MLEQAPQISDLPPRKEIDLGIRKLYLKNSLQIHLAIDSGQDVEQWIEAHAKQVSEILENNPEILSLAEHDEFAARDQLRTELQKRTVH